MDALTPRAYQSFDLGSLLSALSVMIDEQRSVVIHVTAPGPGAGTTTIAREIAIAAAASGWCKVALVTAKPGALSGTRATARRPALMEQFEAAEDIMLTTEELDGVSVATGCLYATGVSMPRVQSVRGLYGLLRSSYTLIVVDCAPVLSSHDGAMLVSAADGTILVVEAERTPIAEILGARDVLDQLGAPLLGLVLNKERRRIPAFLSRLL